MNNDERPMIDPSLLRGMTQRRLSRRGFMRAAGVGAGALSLSALLAACGGGDTTGGTAGSTGGQTVDFTGEASGNVNFANWPAYIDKSKDASGEKYSPSLRGFTQETGITVNYQEVIDSNPEFFARIRPQLEAGDDTGWDLIVITNSQQLTALLANGWVVELDPSLRPNFDKHAADWAKSPNFDPGNKYTMCWQSGITGIGYNTNLVKAPILSLDDLADPNKVPPSSVGMLKSDMPDFVMINLGIDPKTSGPEEWQEAADWLLMQRETGVVRQYYEQGYLDDITTNNLAASMAWSGDILYNKIWIGLPLEFVMPEGGALLWIDNMMIPVNSANPVATYQYMDSVYVPETAQMITEWVQYMSPVPEVQELIKKHAEEQEAKGYKGYANKLALTAESEFLWPSKEFLSKTSFARDLTTDEEIDEYNSIFLPISQS